jgi:hypothetical protein
MVVSMVMEMMMKWGRCQRWCSSVVLGLTTAHQDRNPQKQQEPNAKMGEVVIVSAASMKDMVIFKSHDSLVLMELILLFQFKNFFFLE